MVVAGLEAVANLEVLEAVGLEAAAAAILEVLEADCGDHPGGPGGGVLEGPEAEAPHPVKLNSSPVHHERGGMSGVQIERVSHFRRNEATLRRSRRLARWRSWRRRSRRWRTAGGSGGGGPKAARD